MVGFEAFYDDMMGVRTGYECEGDGGGGSAGEERRLIISNLGPD